MNFSIWKALKISPEICPSHTGAHGSEDTQLGQCPWLWEVPSVVWGWAQDPTSMRRTWGSFPLTPAADWQFTFHSLYYSLVLEKKSFPVFANTAPNADRVTPQWWCVKSTVSPVQTCSCPQLSWRNVCWWFPSIGVTEWQVAMEAEKCQSVRKVNIIKTLLPSLPCSE